MRGEIKRLHQELGTTMIYVTHDQIEAMTLADRIVLLRDGLIEQQGAPLDLFERPATRFVAGFLGSPQMNFMPGELVRGDGGARRAPERRHRAGAARGRAQQLAGGREPGRRPRRAARAHEPRRAGDARAGPCAARRRRSSWCSRPARAPTPPSRSAARRSWRSCRRTTCRSPATRIELAIDMNRAILIDPSTDRVI